MKNLTGNIHTVEVAAPLKRDANGLTEFHPLADVCISRKWQSDTAQTYVFNPNRSILKDTFGAAYLYDGKECMSLAEFDLYKGIVLALNGHEDEARLTRIDFKVDNYGLIDPAKWVKLNHLLVGTFIIKHNVTKKNQSETVTVTDGREHKSTKATAGRMEVENYNKSIQKESEGNDYRLELRYGKNRHDRRVEIPQALTQWKKELQSLPAYYEAALERWTRDIMKQWERMKRTDRVTDHHFAQFMRSWDMDICNRKQVEELYRLNGSKNPEAAVNQFCYRYKLTYIRKKDFEEYITALCEAIDQYMNRTVEAYPLDVMKAYPELLRTVEYLEEDAEVMKIS